MYLRISISDESSNFLEAKRIFKRREERVAGDFALDQRQKELRAFWQKLRVKLRPADQEKLAALRQAPQFH